MRDRRIYNRHLKAYEERYGRPMLDFHFTFLAPSKKLKNAYKKHNLPWDGYVPWFTQEVLIPQSEVLEALALDALGQDITLLCTEDSPRFCHRRLLAEEMQRLVPKLEIIVR